MILQAEEKAIAILVNTQKRRTIQVNHESGGCTLKSPNKTTHDRLQKNAGRIR